MKEKLVAVLLASCVALTACSAGGSTQPVPDTSLQTDVVSLQDSGNGQAGSSLPRTVTVNSRESVHVEPDIAEIVYSVPRKPRRPRIVSSKIRRRWISFPPF